MTWFAKELASLQASPRVSFFLHTTRPSPNNTSGTNTPRSNTGPIPKSDPEKATGSSYTVPGTSHSSSSVEKIEFDSPSSITKSSGHPWDASILDIVPGRPDIDALVMDVVRNSGKEERILIGACGPDSLMWDVRRSATNAISIGGPSVELHSEQFGW